MKINNEHIAKTTKFVANYSTVIILLAWIMAFVIPLVFQPRTPDRLKRDKLDYYEISFLAASALFTGIAFAVTFSSLIDQKKNLREQTRSLKLQVVVDIFHKTSISLKEKKFQKIKRYIGSSDYYDDLRLFKSIIKNEYINLENLSVCVKSLNDEVDQKTKERLRTCYDNIISFCSQMEYMGFLQEQTSEFVLVEYYGRTIKTTYQVLKPMVEIKRDNNEIDYLYFHFSNLYYSTIREESRYLAEKERKIKMFVDETETDFYQHDLEG